MHIPDVKLFDKVETHWGCMRPIWCYGSDDVLSRARDRIREYGVDCWGPFNNQEGFCYLWISGKNSFPPADEDISFALLVLHAEGALCSYGVKRNGKQAKV